jgi:hypothetical protein
MKSSSLVVVDLCDVMGNSFRQIFQQYFFSSLQRQSARRDFVLFPNETQFHFTIAHRRESLSFPSRAILPALRSLMIRKIAEAFQRCEIIAAKLHSKSQYHRRASRGNHSLVCCHVSIQRVNKLFGLPVTRLVSQRLDLFVSRWLAAAAGAFKYEQIDNYRKRPAAGGWLAANVSKPE